MRLLLFLLPLLIAGCAQLGTGPQPEKQVAPTPPLHVSPKEQLKQAAYTALQNKALIPGTVYLSKLWEIETSENQLLIEYVLYGAWRHADKEALMQAMDNPITQPWAVLSELEQAGDPTAIEKTLEIYPDALFARHLSAYLKHHSLPVQKVAVFLPLSGRYKQIGKAVRNGMLKQALGSPNPIELRFYDSANKSQLESNYQDALNHKADAIVGPIQKDAIQVLAEISHLPTLFLNEKPTSFGKTFLFATPSEAGQIAGKLSQLNTQRIGVFYKPEGRSAQLQTDLVSIWQGDERRTVSQYYSSKTHEIRRSFDQLLNIDKSRQRKINLRHLLHRPLSFQPRPRQDLQAIVLLGNNREAAIVNPMLKFYGLKIPLIGSSLIMPIHFSENDNLRRDLAGVRFPSFPALLSKNTLNTPLEAWGWDTLSVLTHLPLPPKSCLQGQTGWLQVPEENIDRTLIWLKYTPTGQLTLWSMP